MLSCALAVLMVSEAVSPSGVHRPHQNQRAQIYHLRDWGARNLHFNNLPYLGFSQSPPSVSPREQGTGWNTFFLPLSSSGALGHEEWRAGRTASKRKLENETGNHSLTTQRAGVSFPQGESPREKEAEEGREACLVKAARCSLRSLALGTLMQGCDGSLQGGQCQQGRPQRCTHFPKAGWLPSALEGFLSSKS